MTIWEEFCVRGYYRTYDGMSPVETRTHNTVPDIKKSAGKDENGNDIKVPDNEAIQPPIPRLTKSETDSAERLEAQSPEFKENPLTLTMTKVQPYPCAPQYDGSNIRHSPELNMKLLGDRYESTPFTSRKKTVYGC